MTCPFCARAGGGQFAAFVQDAEDNKAFLAQGHDCGFEEWQMTRNVFDRQ
jgi:hypothetical protein